MHTRGRRRSTHSDISATMHRLTAMSRRDFQSRARLIMACSRNTRATFLGKRKSAGSKSGVAGGRYRGRLCKLVEKTLKERPALIHGRLKKPEEAEKLRSCMEDGNWSKTTISDIVERMEKVAEGR